MINSLPQRIGANPGAVLVDPCAGEGSAVALLAEELGIPEAHVVAAELHHGRGARLAERLPEASITQPCDSQSAENPRQKATLLYLNPPFDAELNASGTRTEQMFLARASEMLKPGGVLAFFAPDAVARLSHTPTGRLRWGCSLTPTQRGVGLRKSHLPEIGG